MFVACFVRISLQSHNISSVELPTVKNATVSPKRCHISVAFGRFSPWIQGWLFPTSVQRPCLRDEEHAGHSCQIPWHFVFRWMLIGRWEDSNNPWCYLVHILSCKLFALVRRGQQSHWPCGVEFIACFVLPCDSPSQMLSCMRMCVLKCTLCTRHIPIWLRLCPILQVLVFRLIGASFVFKITLLADLLHWGEHENYGIWES